MSFDIFLKTIIMKAIKYFYRISYLATSFVLFFGCNNSSNDPVKEAKKENRETIDSMSDNRNVDSTASAIMPTKGDAAFLVNAASGGILEVELGKLAQTNAHNPHVKYFGDMMVRDHSKVGINLKKLATSKNITLPDAISNSQQKEKERLQKLKGDAFDESYINMMVDDHKSDIKEFEKAATNGTNPAVKDFAADNLKMLHIHLDSATSVQKQISPKIG